MIEKINDPLFGCNEFISEGQTIETNFFRKPSQIGEKEIELSRYSFNGFLLVKKKK